MDLLRNCSVYKFYFYFFGVGWGGGGGLLKTRYQKLRRHTGVLKTENLL